MIYEGLRTTVHYNDCTALQKILWSVEHLALQYNSYWYVRVCSHESKYAGRGRLQLLTLINQTDWKNHCLSHHLIITPWSSLSLKPNELSPGLELIQGVTLDWSCPPTSDIFLTRHSAAVNHLAWQILPLFTSWISDGTGSFPALTACSRLSYQCLCFSLHHLGGWPDLHHLKSPWTSDWMASGSRLRGESKRDQWTQCWGWTIKSNNKVPQQKLVCVKLADGPKESTVQFPLQVSMSPTLVSCVSVAGVTTQDHKRLSGIMHFNFLSEVEIETWLVVYSF